MQDAVRLMSDDERVLAAAALHSFIDPMEEGMTAPNFRDSLAEIRCDLESRMFAAEMLSDTGNAARGQALALKSATRYLQTAEERLGQVLADIVAAQMALARGAAEVVN